MRRSSITQSANTWTGWCNSSATEWSCGSHSGRCSRGQVGIAARRFGRDAAAEGDDGPTSPTSAAIQDASWPGQLAFVRTAYRPACPHRRRTGLGGPECIRIPRLHASTKPSPNIAFAGTDITGLCPYDASCLDESVLADVRPQRIRRSGWMDRGDTARSMRVDAALDQCNQPLATSAAAVTHIVQQAGDLAGARRCG